MVGKQCGNAMSDEQFYRLIAVAGISAIIPLVVSWVQQTLKRRAERNAAGNGNTPRRIG
jgi:heme A synthase